MTLLLVEDDPGHARLIEKNLRRALVANAIIILDTGQKAVDFLFGQGADARLIGNLVVLLDLNLPVLDGYQVLKRMKADTRTKHIPVVILTSTDDDREIAKCYDLGCNVYVAKPVEYDKFCEAIKKLGLFLEIVQVPTGIPPPTSSR
jgi:CheY-like chemotaxis protein